LEVNVHGTLRVLDAARRGVGAVIYSSTFEVYGLPEAEGPVLESARLAPVTDYGATKLSGEDHLFAFSDEEKVRAVALRMPALYGPGEATPRALPNFLRQVAAGQRPSIYGDGADLRDQLHARDAALSIVCALRASASGIYNVADGQPHSIADLAREALRISGLGGEPQFLPRSKRRYDFHMNVDKARQELAFEAQIALADGMTEQLRWIRHSA
jgi:nucleoside-diphosphate-sugar epimerase